MNPRHLQLRRPRKDRDVTWARKCAAGELFIWTLWRRDHRRAAHMLIFSAYRAQVEASPASVARAIRATHRELRDFVDEIDLEAMETTA